MSVRTPKERKEDAGGAELIDEVANVLVTIDAVFPKDLPFIRGSVENLYDTTEAFGHLDIASNVRIHRQCESRAPLAVLRDLGIQKVKMDDMAAILDFLIKYYTRLAEQMDTYLHGNAAGGCHVPQRLQSVCVLLWRFPNLLPKSYRSLIILT
jgi:hypothetical protein